MSDCANECYLEGIDVVMNFGESFYEEALLHLQKLIQMDTSSQNEYQALAYLQELAEEEGLTTKLIETAPDRGNLEIMLNPDEEPEIFLLSHVDVVPANEEEWSIPPFSGEIRNGYIWGRGTIDTKQLTIIHLFTLIGLKRLGIEKPVMMLVTSDEEQGSHDGLIQYLKTEGDSFTGKLVLNEGGGFPLVIHGKPFHLIESGQKGVARIELEFFSSTSTNPYLPNHKALYDLNKVLAEFNRLTAREQVPNTVHDMFRIIADEIDRPYVPEKIDEFIDYELPENFNRLMKAMTKTTFSPTRWRMKESKCSGRKAAFTLSIDCRTLPYVTEDILENWLDEILKETNATYEISSFSQGYETELDADLLERIESTLKEDLPEHKVVPYLSIGSSDGRHLAPYNAKVLGYCPTDLDMLFQKVIQMVHGIDERLSIRSFNVGLSQMLKLVHKLFEE